jgi:cytochrome c-type protein NapB
MKMKKLIKRVALGALLATASSYAVSIAACAGCHGQHFEKATMGKSKIVQDMSIKDIIVALKGYKAGTYGDSMKQMMMTQVINVKDADLEAMALLIKIGSGTQTQKATSFAAAAAVAASGGYIDLNQHASDEMRIEQEDLGNRNTVSEAALGLRKTDLYSEKDNTEGAKADYDRPAPGTSTPFERAYRDAPPMIPHSVEGLLPITKMNNQCLGCHLPEVASAVGAVAIPVTHFTNYRPTTILKNGEVIKEGKIVGKELSNVSDIKIAKAKKTDTIYQGRFNCTQCHAPQSKMETAVANTFRPDFDKKTYKSHSSLADAMNEGVE